MAGPTAQSPSPAEGTHLVLYDGVCGLCSRLVQFVLVRDRRAVFSFASLQSVVGRATVQRNGGNPADLNSLYVIADFRSPRARALTKTDAALFVTGQLGWPWQALQAARVVPKAVRDWMYDVVARYRYRVFGRYDQCRLPDPAFRRRFVD